MNLCNFLLSHQIAVLFYFTLGDTHEQLEEKTVPSSLFLRMWAQVTEKRLNGESTAEQFYGRTAAKIPTTKDIFWFQSQTKMPFIRHSGYTALIMNPIP